MPKKDTESLTGILSRQLEQIERYGRLLEEQEGCFQRQDYEGLLKVIARKERLIGRMDNWDEISALATEAAKVGGSQARKARELLEKLFTRLELFSGKENASVKMVAWKKEELAQGIFALRKGRKMIRNYSKNPQMGKARFKDLTG
ncbi:MAG TPA: hypothetical protein VJ417_12905 [Candidatus Glassbacteria bacterium]|nr:hypothetical protein [Candidatus Glassbacteria bacterium]